MSEHVFIAPHLRVQNANAISSPMTWGFPAMTAFIGLMQALERQCRHDGFDVHFHGIGVVCHDANPQTQRSAYGQHTFLLTRNPVKANGQTAAIVEEGRMHLEISLIFKVSGNACNGTHEESEALAQQLDDRLHRMRIAGGSVLPRQHSQQKRHQVLLEPLVPSDSAQLNRIKRRLLPGFALVLREDTLTKQLDTLREIQPDATLMDAWLDLSRFNHGCVTNEEGNAYWETLRQQPGWLVPIPVGYSALSDEIPAHEIANARDPHTPLRFVEPLLSIGEWYSPHRIHDIDELLWRIRPNTDERLFLLDMCASPAANSDDTESESEPEYDTTDY